MSHGDPKPYFSRTATFGRLLRAHRLQAGWSQAVLAERAGLGERAIQRLEADHNRPYRATVEQLVEALSLTAEQRTALLAAVPPATRDPAQPASTTVEPLSPHLRLVRPDFVPEQQPDRDTVQCPRCAARSASSATSCSGCGSAVPGAPAVRSARPLDRRTLRIPRGRLIGRDSDASAVRDLLLRPDVGLVTLTGPGGSGKTRLAIQVAANLADQFEDGVVFVNLALVTDPAAVPTAIVQALELMDHGDASAEDRLRLHLQDRYVLLLLDNFEHVLAARTLVADLLDACARLSVLVTSRAVLRVYGEREVMVPPLASPIDGQALALDTAAPFPAVELFVERAQAVRPDFALTAENVDAVVAICRQLDGLPLAIELAAARSRLLSPRAMLGRLERRLTLLTDGPRDLPARQQTLRGAIGWSYDLLEDTERQVFRCLGVFVGGFDLGAGCWVSRLGAGDTEIPPSETRDRESETLDHLGSLVDKSLLVTLPERDGEPRFGMLQTIREFAIEQLEASGEAVTLYRRHAEYYVALAEEADPRLITSEQVTWLARLTAEHANFSAALTWLFAQDDEESARLALRLSGALHWYWWLGGAVTEGRAWVRAALARARSDDPLAAPARARALYAAGGLAMVQGEYRTAVDRLDEASALYRRLGDRQGLGRSMTYRAVQDPNFGDEVSAHAGLLASLQVLREVDDHWGLALAGSNLGAVTRRLGDPHEADRLLEEYVALARRTGDRYLLGSALPKWANVAVALGDLDRAEVFGREALGLFRELNDGWWTARCLHHLTTAAFERGDYLRASRLLGAAEYLLHVTGARFPPSDAAESRQMAGTMRTELGEAPFEAARSEGRNATLEQIVRYAMDAAAEHVGPSSGSPPPP